MGLSIGFRSLISLLPAIQATGRLAVALAGLPPAERASLRWTHKTRSVVFQAAVGAFWASTAASASTGASRLGGAAQRALTVDGAGVATPRVVRARPSGPMGGTRQLRPCGGRRGLDRRGHLRPVHRAPPIAESNRPVSGFTHQHGTPRGRLSALPRHLEVPGVIPHDPIVGEDALLLELEHPIERRARRDAPMEVLGRGRRDGKPLVVFG